MLNIRLWEFLLLVLLILTAIFMIIFRNKMKSFNEGYSVFSVILFVIFFVIFGLPHGTSLIEGNILFDTPTIIYINLIVVGIIQFFNYILATIICYIFRFIFFPDELKKIKESKKNKTIDPIKVPSIKRCPNCNTEWTKNYEYCPLCSKKLEYPDITNKKA